MAATISKTTVFGTKKTAVDGVVYASINVGYLADETDVNEGMKGFQIVKMACEPEVCDAIDANGKFPMELDLEVRKKIKSGTMTERAVRVVEAPSKPTAAKS